MPPVSLAGTTQKAPASRSWFADIRKAMRRWSISEHVILSFVHQESSFRHNAIPPIGKMLGTNVWLRKSSAKVARLADTYKPAQVRQAPQSALVLIATRSAVRRKVCVYTASFGDATGSLAGTTQKASDSRSWFADIRKATRRWSIPEHVILSFVHQESSFRHNAKPPMGKLLGFIPWFRKSSAKGYAQAKDETWSDYERENDRLFASRNDFGDVPLPTRKMHGRDRPVKARTEVVAMAGLEPATPAL